jgi:VCBS repeat-containing protein
MAAKNVTSTAAKPTKPTQPPAPSPVVTATPDTASITEDAKSSVVSGNVLANDSSGLTVASVNSQPVTSTSSISGTYGTLAIDGTGKWAYTLNNGDARVQGLGENGTLTETFPYIATAKDGSTVSSFLTVTITGTNDAPVAKADTGTVGQGGKVTLDVLANDMDVDGPSMTITAVKVPAAQGTAKIVDGKVEFTAAKGFTGDAAITYTLSDGKLSAQGNAVVTVTPVTQAPVNQAPVAQSGTKSGDEDTVITGSVTATDANKDTLTYSLVQGPKAEQGKLVLQPNGSYSFTPAKDYSGTVTFTYKANDGTADSNVATMTLTVAEVAEPNTAPVATGGDASGAEDTTITGQVGGTDAEASPLTYKLVAPVAGLTLNPNGSYSYSPTKDFAGEVEFQYVANDGALDSVSKTVTITVTPVDEPNTAPVATGGNASGDEDAAEITGQVAATDLDGDALTYAIHGNTGR